MTGVKVCAHSKNGTMSWERMVDIKQSYPLELAEYANAQGIDETPELHGGYHMSLGKRGKYSLLSEASTTSEHISLDSRYQRW